VFDNRGVGRSTGVTGRYGPDYGMRDMAADAADLIAKLGLRRVAVVGWSMGGMIAQELVAGSHRGIDRLVLIATAPPGPRATPLAATTGEVLSSHGPDAFGKIMGVLFPPDALSDAMKCFASDMFALPGYKETPFDDAVAAQQNRAMERWFADAAAANALRRVTVPTLIVAGERDDVLAHANAEALNELIPRSQLRIVDDAGHAMMFQYPLALARMIDAFVQR
jgi:pimeloyl-ACP methyl ester carboxylesterase